MEALIPILIILVLILLNGVFVAAEFAIIGAPRSAIQYRAERGDTAARRVLAILRDPKRQDLYIATAQLGITFASLGLGMYGEHMLADWLVIKLEAFGGAKWIASHGVASVAAVLVLTYFHIVLGEMVPKSLALSYPERTALRIAGPMLLIKALGYPLVILLNGIGNAVLRLMGIRRELGTSHFHSPEELELLIGESERGGLLDAESSRVLRELFDFGQLTAGQVAVARVHVIAVPLGSAPEALAQIVRESPHARYPVYERDLDHIAGYVHAKSILRLLRDDRPLSAQDLRPVAFVPETMELEKVLQAIREAGSQLAVVMDEHGGTAGVITVEDLSAEILGETEEAGKTPHWSWEGDSRLRVAGTLRLEELGELLEGDYEHQEVETVSGIVLHLLGRAPAAGDAVVWQGARFEVTATAGRGVRECLVSVISSSSV